MEARVSACLEQHLTATARLEIKVLRARMDTIYLPFREMARMCWRGCMPIVGLRGPSRQNGSKCRNFFIGEKVSLGSA